MLSGVSGDSKNVALKQSIGYRRPLFPDRLFQPVFGKSTLKR